MGNLYEEVLSNFSKWKLRELFLLSKETTLRKYSLIFPRENLLHFVRICRISNLTKFQQNFIWFSSTIPRNSPCLGTFSSRFFIFRGCSINPFPVAAPARRLLPSLASRRVATDAVASCNFMNANDSSDAHPEDGNRVHRVDRARHADRVGCWHRHPVQRNHPRAVAAWDYWHPCQDFAFSTWCGDSGTRSWPAEREREEKKRLVR